MMCDLCHEPACSRFTETFEGRHQNTFELCAEHRDRMYGFLKGEQIAELERKDLTALHPPVTLTGDQLKGGLTND